MKFVSYQTSDGRRLSGVLDGTAVVAVDDLLQQMELDPASMQALHDRGIAPATHGVMRWLQAGAGARETTSLRIRERLADTGVHRVPLDSVRLQPPLPRPGKIVGVGRNYADHAKETGVDPFEKPRIIFKVPSSIAAPGAAIHCPEAVKKMDFEGELAVVIGSFAKNVKVEQALAYVGGYSLLNDISAREFQFDISPPQTTFAKSMDGFCPFGPAMATPDEVPDPQNLRLRTTVNGAVMQDAGTVDMLFPVATLISYISQYMTLEPGDVLATGTPAGIGAFRKPPVWLAPGDQIEVNIEELGTLLTVIR